MKQFIKKMAGSVILAVIAIVAAIFALIRGFDILLIFSLLLLAGCALALIFEVRDYQFYKQLSAKMHGKTLDEKLKILSPHEECWLSYASPDEVKQFRDEAESNPENKFLNYLLERAAMYGK